MLLFSASPAGPFDRQVSYLKANYLLILHNFTLVVIMLIFLMCIFGHVFQANNPPYCGELKSKEPGVNMLILTAVKRVSSLKPQ